MNVSEGYSGDLGPPVIWIDLLPGEIRRRVVQFASICLSVEEQLCIAESTPSLREALISALEFRFIAPSNTTPRQLERLARCFVGRVQEVDYLSSEEITDACVELLQSPTLQEAAINGTHAELIHVSKAKPLRKLTVAGLMRNRKPLLATLAAHHDLKHLRLTCRHQIFRRTDNVCQLTKTVPEQLSSLCPNLEALEISTVCAKTSTIIKLVSGLMHLQRLTLELYNNSETFSDEDIPVLKAIPSVELRRIPGASIVARNLGSVVKVLGPWPFVNASELQAITKECTNIRELWVEFDEDFEVVGPSYISRLTHLNSLHIIQHRIHRIPSGGAMAIVRAASKLRELHIEAHNVSMYEVMEILEYLGPRLEKLSLPEFNYSETDLHLLAQVLETLAIYNPNIGSLNMDHEDNSFIATFASPSFAAAIQGVCEALAKLKRRNPLFDHSDVLHLFNSWSPTI